MPGVAGRPSALKMAGPVVKKTVGMSSCPYRTFVMVCPAIEAGPFTVTVLPDTAVKFAWYHPKPPTLLLIRGFIPSGDESVCGAPALAASRGSIDDVTLSHLP